MTEQPTVRAAGPHRPSGPGEPPDQAARTRITEELDATLFVEAGAGSGKTTALVDRVLALVASGHVELREVAAITFTDKAAAELRDRVRRRLEEQAAAASDGEAAGRFRRALDQLDGAAIGTLHAFAQRLLTEHPIEAGLPPSVEVLDEVSSAVAFDERWSIFLDELLARDDLRRTLLLFFACGPRPESVRALARTFGENWDLVAERVLAQQVPDVPSVHALVHEATAEILDVCATPCRDPGDKLRLKLDEIASWVADLAATEDEVDLLDALDPDGSPKPPSFKPGRAGKSTAYDCDLDELRDRLRAAGSALTNVRGAVGEACAKAIGRVVARFTLDAADERRRAGQLEFHDLLVLARALLRHPVHGPVVRGRLHDRYRRLLLDESQDTDPIQIDLAVRIAAADPAAPYAGAAPWDQVALSPGRLFLVGDPKQSIYRFRRADIANFLRAKTRFGGPDGRDLVELTANFRTTRPVIDWVNHTFGRLIEPSEHSQPSYLALEALRPAAPVGPPVAVLGRAEHPGEAKADDMREAEAEEVAATVARVVHEGWLVDDGCGGWRPARLGDITVLVPSRTSLPFLEDALDRAGVAFRAESSSLVYATRAVRDLLMVVRAVDDPTNALHLMAALRTPLLACGDDDLFRFKVEGRGRWSYLADQPDSVPADDPVRAGLAYLRSLYDDRHWLAPSELLDRIARERRAFELGFSEGRPRDVWRRLRFVVDQARGWHEATGGNLRQYLHWVAGQASEGARVEEVVLPETDDDAVRIMTVHAAKGLEFPVTVVSGMSTVPRGRPALAEVAFPPDGGVGYRVGKHLVTAEYAAWAPIDEQMGVDERIRLLYVACTRARDHLVVSLHRKARAGEAEPAKLTNAELLLRGMGPLADDLPDGPAAAGAVPPPERIAATAPPSYEEWNQTRAGALQRAARPTTVSATALTEEGTLDPETEPDPGLEKRPRDLDLPPWLKGRYGTAVGRAVHGVLQSIDLATGHGLEAAVAAQCEAEGVVDRTDDVARLVGAALGSASVREAAGADHWREIYVCTPVEDRLLEGYVDLLYRGPDGLVVVDYKTSATADAGELDRRVEGYRTQGASYALTVSATAGGPVVRVTFCFLTPDGPVERHLPGLDDAVAGVRALVADGREVELP